MTTLVVVGVEAVINFALALLFIDLFGVAGAALSLVIAEFVGLLLDYWQLNKVVRLSLRSQLFKPLPASISMAFLLIVLERVLPSTNVIVLIIGGALAYLFSFVLLKVVTREDLIYVRGLLAR